MSFDYFNKETTVQLGGKVVRKVTIKNGKGHKSVTSYRRGKKIGTVKKTLHKQHIELIKRGKFIPGLFLDCNCKLKNKTYKRKHI